MAIDSSVREQRQVALRIGGTIAAVFIAMLVVTAIVRPGAITEMMHDVMAMM